MKSKKSSYFVKMIKRKKPEIVRTNSYKIDFWRWLGFLLAVIGAYILGNADLKSQWLGWSICTISCLIWIMMGVKDKDVPRTLMEIMYFVIGARAIFNWSTFA